jgi:hypothetical protein
MLVFIEQLYAFGESPTVLLASIVGAFQYENYLTI